MSGQAYPADNQTLGELIDNVTSQLRSADIEDPRREARRLVTEVLALDAAAALANPNAIITAKGALHIRDASARRAAHEPLSRILGSREFYGRTFQLSADTLDPRPDTEALIEFALELMSNHIANDISLRILDIGTGSGCIAVTLACELPKSKVIATDISAGALKTAVLNADRHSVADHITFVETDGLRDVEGAFDLVVSNPPYIRSSTLTDLDPEVLNHDPLRALDGGQDGLKFYRQWISQLASLVPRAAVVLEVGADCHGNGQHAEDSQAEQVQALLRNAFNRQTITKKDLSGHTRCVAIAPVKP
ncbi:MAG: peptide chain release factor N(5)-glutamine methyltransferase [Pseudomonadota bacterium]